MPRVFSKAPAVNRVATAEAAPNMRRIGRAASRRAERVAADGALLLLLRQIFLQLKQCILIKQLQVLQIHVHLQ